VCYVAFWDEITLLEQEAEGKKLGEDRTIGVWRVIVVHNLPFTDQRLNGKIPKVSDIRFTVKIIVFLPYSGFNFVEIIRGQRIYNDLFNKP